MSWLPLALLALLTWSVQRVVTKAALVRWSTARFYRWNAVLSLLVYVPFAVVAPPEVAGLPGAFGLSLLMALTFWVTTEATRRGPVGVVAPLTATSPALTVVLAVALLGERPDALGWAGVAFAVGAAVLLAARPASASMGGWLGLAVASLVLQGLGAFLAKIVVSDAGPTTLLVPSVLVQLAAGPASVVVPLVATSPVLGGLLGIVVLRERTTARQSAGIAVGLVGILLLARPGSTAGI